ncbi:hypothetical protein QE193_23955 (plasmid) [Arsenophonus nasoniae]|nr:hypothetical protein [Arsenophonus nasoniae]WGM18188.1 hypothetical protein QE193_23955 [Arsenophonus nasoniae]
MLKRKGHGIVLILGRYLKRHRYLRQNCGITEGCRSSSTMTDHRTNSIGSRLCRRKR